MSIQKLISDYLDMEGYGANLIIKKYCNYPWYLPLPAHLEHGWTALPEAIGTDLNQAPKKGLMLVYSKRRLNAWKRSSDIPAVIMGSPFVLYRRLMQIKKSKRAKGTVAFPSHSTIFLESQFDIDKYCQILKNLDKKFQPITICLLHTDIKLGRDKIYQKHGFKVVSAGKKLRGSLSFVKNFYKILSSHRYSTSNEVGSYTFYSVEMSIPFFLLGEEPLILNKDGNDPNVSEKSRLTDYPAGKKVTKLFSTKHPGTITRLQKKFVLDEVGIGSYAGANQLKAELTSNRNIRYYLISTPMFVLMSIFKALVPMELAYFVFKKLYKK